MILIKYIDKPIVKNFSSSGQLNSQMHGSKAFSLYSAKGNSVDLHAHQNIHPF